MKPSHVSSTSHLLISFGQLKMRIQIADSPSSPLLKNSYKITKFNILIFE